MGAEISKFTHDDVFPTEHQDYTHTRELRDGDEFGAKAPKLKAFKGLSVDYYYIRKEFFAAGSFGRAYSCLDSDGRAWALKEVRLALPRNPLKIAEMEYDRPHRFAGHVTRTMSPLPDFKREVRLMEQVNLLQGPVECFKNERGTKGYVVQRMMAGTGVDLMGRRGRGGLLTDAFEGLAGQAPARANIRPGAIFRHVLKQLAKCAAEVHAKNIILSDIKPANVLYRDGTIELSDFGAAVAIKGFRGSIITATRPYLAPEASRNRKVDRASDVYALGMTIAEWMLKRHPLDRRPQNCLLEPIDYENYLAGDMENRSHFDTILAELKKVDSALAKLVCRMLGESNTRPTMEEIIHSPATHVYTSEEELIKSAWKNVPKRSPRVLMHQCKIENEVISHKLPYKHEPKAWEI